ncbi:response regulator [Breznakiella homolactica]|uniref:histidine kinase n=1 Tax=Breznakiella homolactica TaxID=2798577 RepID=A0A7T7XK43_9SPIR|nr:response regulator [Breznakiella homolactica]QQO07718.1 response regulator [Breznakiella homolactica]
MKFKTITARIIISVIPLVAVITILSVVNIYFAMNGQITTQFDERMTESLRLARLSIYAELLMNAKVAESLAIYAETCSRETIEKGELARFLLRSIPSNKNTVGGGIWFEPYSLYPDERYFGPYVYIKDGKAVYSDEYGSEVDFHQEAWYINGKQSGGETVWSDVYYDPVAAVTMITSSVPFYRSSGEFLGVATADMALTDIKAISADIAVGRTGAAFILGAKGEFISFIDESRSSDMLIGDDPDHELVSLGRQVLNNRSGSETLSWQGRQYRAFYTGMEEIDWHLVVIIDNAEVGQSANDLIRSLALVPVVGLFFVAWSILMVARYLKRVTNKVNSFADQAASGDLRERILITEHDEFGVMEDRLNRMMDTMAEMSEHSEKMLEMAQAASRAKTEFLSKMSHEMRTPMNAIIGMVQVSEQTDDREKLRDCLLKIDHASRNLLELINNVLDMAKIEANKVELEVARFSIREVFESIANVFWVKAEEKKLALTLTADDSVPGSIWSDRFRYSQVVTNLVSNAVKFTPEGGAVSVAAELLKETATGFVIRTTVADTGIGVAPESAGRLFGAFEQANSGIFRQYGGTGLGLSISKSLVELMGGTIWYEPNGSAGSRFVFTITAEKTGKEETAPAEKLTPDAFDFRGKSILVAEDVEINREIVAALLEDTGVAIDFAENGLEACGMFSKNPEKYDLIFMDIQMPEMDGLAATKKIRRMEKGKKIPIIAMSANAFREDVNASLEAGMNGHISKPLDLNVVLSTLHSFLK